MTTYLTPNSEYQDAREGAIQAAIDLFGAGSLQHLMTAEAWDGVGVYGEELDMSFEPVLAMGSLIYAGQLSDSLDTEFDSDTINLPMDPNQKFSIVVQGEPGFEPTVTVLDPGSRNIGLVDGQWFIHRGTDQHPGCRCG